MTRSIIELNVLFSIFFCFSFLILSRDEHDPFFYLSFFSLRAGKDNPMRLLLQLCTEAFSVFYSLSFYLSGKSSSTLNRTHT
jgi:hypothetical protein